MHLPTLRFLASAALAAAARLRMPAAAAGAQAASRLFVPGWVPSPDNSGAPTRRGPPLPRGVVPEAFDSRDAWPRCGSIRRILDQGQCGSCWAFGATGAFTDRWCVATNQTANPQHSVQATLTCSFNKSSCHGGDSSLAWDYFHTHGIPSAECQPYTVPTCPGPKTYGHNPCWGPPLPGSKSEHPTPPCLPRCTNSSAARTLYRSAAPHFVPGPGDDDIMREIQARGPVTACFTVYDDLLRYTGGVYKRANGTAEMGGHCVKIIGWGADGSDGAGKPLPYWLVANEWSTAWGEGGFFRILRGDNGAAFPSQLSAGIPRV